MFGKMKKLLAATAVGVMTLLTLAGCGNDNTNNAATDSPQILKVGSAVNYAPFEFKDENATEYQGFDMDLIRAVGKEMGVEVNINDIDFDRLIPELQKKNIDVAIAGLTINDKSKEDYVFSEPYYTSSIVVVVSENNYQINTLTNLEGKKIAVETNTSFAAKAKGVPNAEVVELADSAACFNELKKGGIDAVIIDRAVSDYFISHNENSELKILPEIIDEEYYCIAVAKDNTDLLNKINDALKKLRDSGEYDKIYEKWFGKMN